MNKTMFLPALALACCASVAIPALTGGDARATAQKQANRSGDEGSAGGNDIDRLYTLVRQARADMAEIRRMVGLDGERREGRGEHAEGDREGRGEHAGREGRGEHAGGGREGRGEHGGREGRGEHAGGGREGRGEHGRREGRGEHGEGREGGEEGGKRMGLRETWDSTRNGARLVLRYDAASQSFKGTVRNMTAKTLEDVRVEVHLSNGVELGPTKRTSLEPRQSMPVELSAADHRFTWWTTHPEHGTEENHGPGHEEGGDEHRAVSRGDKRPADPALRPLYIELLLLQREIVTLRDAVTRRRGRAPETGAAHRRADR